MSIEFGLVLAGDVYEEGAARSPPHLKPRSGIWRRGFDEHETGGVEHGGLGVDRFAEVLGADEGMVATERGYEVVDLYAVGGDEAADIIGGEIKDTLDPIQF